MKAVAFLGKGRAGLIDIPRPELRDGAAMVRITRTAACGSDFGIDKANYLDERDQPLLIGHEAVGIIETSATARFAVGQRVGILVISGCMHCAACQRGHFSLCDKPGQVRPVNAEYAVVPEANLIALPADLSYEQGLLGFGCGIGVALGGVEKLALSVGTPVGVMGCGPIGLSVIVVLQARGARPVAIDINRGRLATATDLGAVTALNPENPHFDAPELLPDGARLRHLILCTGSGQALLTSLTLLAKTSTLVLLGAPPLDGVKTFSQVIAKDLTLRGSWHYGMEHVPMILSILRGFDYPEKILTHTFPVSHCDKAYRLFAAGDCGKVLLNWEE